VLSNTHITVRHIPRDLESEAAVAIGCRSWSAAGKLTAEPELAIRFYRACAHSLPALRGRMADTADQYCQSTGERVTHARPEGTSLSIDDDAT